MMKQKIVILGGGESGAGAAVLAQKEQFDVLVSDMSAIKPFYKEMLDSRSIRWEEGKHSEEEILSANLIVKSPGIPEKAPIIQKIKQQNIPILSEIEFAGRYTDAKMVCITGSNGKTTTTMLTWHIFKKAGIDVGLAGNVGNSLALQVAEDPHDIYIIELSSFQLDNMYDFKADIAVLLNITPDHLDRYEYKMQNYVNSKFRILQNQTVDDAFIYWQNDPLITAEIAKKTPAATCYPFSEKRDNQTKGYTENNELVLDTKNGDFRMELSSLSLKGTHNLYNSLAASLVAKISGIGDDVIRQSLSDFEGVEHRLEKVAVRNQICYINDSKATNVNSCFYALQSMTTPVILILGGTDKGNDYTEIEQLVKEKVRGLVFLGVDNSRLHTFFDGKVADLADARSMREAVDRATQFARPGDTVLLSPCCASFDLFKNYEDRGDQFKACVEEL